MAPACLDSLRALVAGGSSLEKAAQRLAISKSAAYRLLVKHGMGEHGDRRRRPFLPEQLRNRVLRMVASGLGYREIARRIGCSVSTVLRIRDGSSNFASCNARRCDGCGHTVRVWPCVACTAKAATSAA